MTLLSKLEQLALNPLEAVLFTNDTTAENRSNNNIDIRDMLASELVNHDKNYAVYACETRVC